MSLLCPIKLNDPPTASAFFGECVRDKCAWWEGDRCAILMIANALYDINQNGIAMDRREY